MTNRIHSFDQRILDASKPFGEAMVAVAARIPSDGVLQQALAIRAQHKELDNTHQDAYEQEVHKFFKDNGIKLDEKSEDFAAMLGYLNIKAVDAGFSPTIDAFNQRVLAASQAYRSSVSNRSYSERFSSAKDRLRDAIVAGQFDTGPASVIIIGALTGPAVGASGVGSPG
jgi:hypothetical protein